MTRQAPNEYGEPLSLAHELQEIERRGRAGGGDSHLTRVCKDTALPKSLGFPWLQSRPGLSGPIRAILMAAIGRAWATAQISRTSRTEAASLWFPPPIMPIRSRPIIPAYL